MKRKFFVIAASLTAGVTFISYRAASQGVPATSATPVPLTATIVETQVDPAGVPVGTDVWTLAISGSRSYVDIHESHDGVAIGPKRIIVDVKKRQRVAVDPPTESLTTYPLSQKAVDTMVNSLFACSDDPAGEHKIFKGYRAVKVTRESNTGNVKLQYENWIVPELGCLALNSTVTRYQKGVLQAHKYKVVTALKLGEPDSTLFELPQAFVERKPSQVFSEAARRKGVSCPECEQHSGIALDKAYDLHH